uniref:Uncharacterized protein n=1 Tax=Anguilla anguilla TaxID=7936 RepID=A0A0E9TMU0_ANGAN
MLVQAWAVLVLEGRCTCRFSFPPVTLAK